MTKEDFNKLKPGDTVTRAGSNAVWIVTGNYGNNGVTLVYTELTFNPSEWEKLPPDSTRK